MRALIVGAGGQLGMSMVPRWATRYDVVAVTRAELDVTDGAAVAALAERVRPTVIVNCSAYTDVDRSEDEPVRAFAVNAMAVRWLARAASSGGAAFVHYSTDFVFDGQAEAPYTEGDAPNPKGAYAMSKLLGEWFAAEAPRHYVLRVESLFGGPRAKSSVDKILDGLKSGVPVRAFADRTVSPSFVDDVIAATDALISGDAAPGLYHCVNSGWTTWVGVAKELAALIGRREAPIEEVQMADLKLRAPRPLFAALSNAKLASAGFQMPTWQDALRRYVTPS